MTRDCPNGMIRAMRKSFAHLAFIALIGAGAAMTAAATPPTPSLKSPPASSSATMIEAEAATCPAQAKQGGLIVCKAPPGARVYKNAELVSIVDAAGIATVGLKTNEADGLRVSIDTDDGALRNFDIAVIPREDPVRYLSGLDCDKVDARTEEQKAHAARSWEKKTAAFARFEAPTADGIHFIRPANGPFSSPFGPKRHYTGVSRVTGQKCTKTSVHLGLDMAVMTGTDLLAPLGGTVTLADPDLYYEGGTIFLDHGWGLVSVFMHLSEVDVEPGQVVKAGERLGATGNTGRTTGPHLHWAVKWRPGVEGAGAGFYIDPALLLELKEVWVDEQAREQDQAD